jgi:hypothetical protein
MSMHSDSDIENDFGSEDDSADCEGSTSTGVTGTSDDNKPGEIAVGETKYIFRLRLVVFTALVLAGLSVSLVIYFLTANAQEGAYQSAFEGSARKVVSSFEAIAAQKLSAIGSLGLTATSYARRNNSSWPFVTMNDFQQRAASARSLSQSLFLEMLPIISDANHLAWENYSLANKGWLDEGRAYQKQLGLGDRRLQTGDFFKNSTLDFSSGISNRIYTLDANWQPIIDNGTGPFYPIWQSSPVIKRDLVNYNVIQ